MDIGSMTAQALVALRQAIDTELLERRTQARELVKELDKIPIDEPRKPRAPRSDKGSKRPAKDVFVDGRTQTELEESRGAG